MVSRPGPQPESLRSPQLAPDTARSRQGIAASVTARDLAQIVALCPTNAPCVPLRLPEGQPTFGFPAPPETSTSPSARIRSIGLTAQRQGGNDEPILLDGSRSLQAACEKPAEPSAFSLTTKPRPPCSGAGASFCNTPHRHIPHVCLLMDRVRRTAQGANQHPKGSAPQSAPPGVRRNGSVGNVAPV